MQLFEDERRPSDATAKPTLSLFDSDQDESDTEEALPTQPAVLKKTGSVFDSSSGEEDDDPVLAVPGPPTGLRKSRLFESDDEEEDEEVRLPSSSAREDLGQG